MTEFRSVAEDIEWLRDDWWLGPAGYLSDGHLRRGSAALGLLLVDGLMQRAWSHYGFEGEPTVAGPDLVALATHHGTTLEHAVALIAGGACMANKDRAFVGLFRADNPETGVPAEAESGFAVRQLGIERDASLLSTPSALDPLVSRQWPLSAYVEAPAAVRHGTLISRHDIIEYFRKHVGGADHYAAHDPADSGRLQITEVAERNQVIEQLGGIVHVEYRSGVYFELLSIGQAIGRSRDLLELARKIREGEERERRTTPHLLSFERPASPDSVLVLSMPDPKGHLDPDAQLLCNLLHVTSPDIPIYRMFRLEHVRTMLQNRALTLVAPRKWHDPCEDLVSHTVVHLRSKALGVFRYHVHAQCWSLEAESDALWRIYSTFTEEVTTRRNTSIAQEGVRVRTTARSLLRALWSASPVDPAKSCFFGGVRYMPKREVLHEIEGIIPSLLDDLSNGQRQAESLLLKRTPFAWEREARLILVNHQTGVRHDDLFQIPVDANSLFKHLTLDPRLSAEDVHDRETELRALGFAGEIVQSGLYERTQIEVWQ